MPYLQDSVREVHELALVLCDFGGGRGLISLQFTDVVGDDLKDSRERASNAMTSASVARSGSVRLTHVHSGLVLFGHLILDLQSAQQLFEAHHGHWNQPERENHSAHDVT